MNPVPQRQMTQKRNSKKKKKKVYIYTDKTQNSLTHVSVYLTIVDFAIGKRKKEFAARDNIGEGLEQITCLRFIPDRIGRSTGREMKIK